MDFELSSAEKAFRDEVRAWLKTNAPRDDGDLETSEFIDNRRAWQKKLHEAGYVGIQHHDDNAVISFREVSLIRSR